MDEVSIGTAVLHQTLSAHISRVAADGISLLHPRLPVRRRPQHEHHRPHRRHHRELGLLAARRADLLVRAGDNDAIHVRPGIHHAGETLPHVPLAATAHGGVVCHGAVGAAHQCGCGTPGDILEPRAHILHRHQHGAVRAGAAMHRQLGGVAAATHLHRDIRHLPLP